MKRGTDFQVLRSFTDIAVEHACLSRALLKKLLARPFSKPPLVTASQGRRLFPSSGSGTGGLAQPKWITVSQHSRPDASHGTSFAITLVRTRYMYESRGGQTAATSTIYESVKSPKYGVPRAGLLAPARGGSRFWHFAGYIKWLDCRVRRA